MSTRTRTKKATQPLTEEQLMTHRICSRCKHIKDIRKFIRFGANDTSKSLKDMKLWKACYDCRTTGRIQNHRHREKISKTAKELSDAIDDVVVGSATISTEEDEEDNTLSEISPQRGPNPQIDSDSETDLEEHIIKPTESEESWYMGWIPVVPEHKITIISRRCYE